MVNQGIVNKFTKIEVLFKNCFYPKRVERYQKTGKILKIINKIKEKRSSNCNYILDDKLWLQLDDRTNIKKLSVYTSRLSD